jgi:hypothetical protein
MKLKNSKTPTTIPAVFDSFLQGVAMDKTRLL